MWAILAGQARARKSFSIFFASMPPRPSGFAMHFCRPFATMA